MRALLQSDIFFANQDTTVSIRRSVIAQKLFPVVRGIYSHRPIKPEDAIEFIQNNTWKIVAHYFPEALLCDRTAFELRRSPKNCLFVIHSRFRPLILPGLAVFPRKGIAPQEDDGFFAEGLRVCSQDRALLENMRPSRETDIKDRNTLSPSEMEEWIDKILRLPDGETTINRLRDFARDKSIKLSMPQEFKKIDKIIGAMLGTRKARLISPIDISRSKGEGFDQDRLTLFEILTDHLHNLSPSLRSERPAAEQAFLPFFESYFSNTIEGSQLTVEEAFKVVSSGEILAQRPKDSHDILGTFQIVSDPREMALTPKNFPEFEQLLCKRHFTLLQASPTLSPGEYKTQENQAGNTLFVTSNLVRGTLKKGFEFYQTLPDGFKKATFMMFLVSEVHPFTDGNGRIARIMMNAELVAEKQQRIMIVNVNRPEYISGLQALSNNKRPTGIVQVLDFAQRFACQIDFSNFSQANALLERCNAFVESSKAVEYAIKLTLPSKLLPFAAALRENQF